MREDLRVVEDRVKRFERLGGVDLSRVDPEDPFLAMVHVGTAEHKKAVFHFRCPVCGNQVTNDQEMPPACTGPGWLDVHPLEPMELDS